jgi:DNA-directed RNA polymerase specialized sigma24 family protein
MTDERIVCRKLVNGGVEYLNIVDETLKGAPLTEAEIEIIRSRIPLVIERELPSWVRSATIAAASASIHKDGKQFFRRKRAQPHDAEILANSVLDKIHRAVFGRPPWGNVWAWVRQIQARVFADYCKAMHREREIRRLLLGSPVAVSCENRALAVMIFEEWLARLPLMTQKVVKLLRDGATLSEVADAVELPLDEVETMIQEIAGPEDEPPLPNKVLRKRLS